MSNPNKDVIDVLNDLIEYSKDGEKGFKASAEDIARSGASHLDEVLEMVPGLHVAPSTISRLDSVYSICSGCFTEN